MLSGLKKIWYFAGVEKSKLNKSIVLEFIYALFNMFQIVAIYYVIQAIVGEGQAAGVGIKALILILISIIGKTLVNYFAQLNQVHAGYFMVANKRMEIGNLLKTVPMGFFNVNNIGRITGVLTTVLDDVENSAPMVLVFLLGGFINSVVFTVMVIFFDWRIGIVVIVGTVLYLIVTSEMEKKSRALAPKRQRAKSNLVENVLEQVQGMSVVKAFNLTGRGDDRVRAALEDSRYTNLAMEKLYVPYTIGQDLILKMSTVVMIVLTMFIYTNGNMDILKAIMCIIMSFMVFSSIQSAGSAMAILRVATSSIEEAEEAEKMPIMDIDGKNITVDNNDIEFKNVSFSYDKRQILKDISIKIPQKSMTAIIGPSGSGKTTMCNLISRFWDVDSGSVSIGGVDVREYSLESLMSRISTVFQNVYLFQDTIENNIKFGNPDIGNEEVVNAAKKAECHDFIMSLSDGYDTVIGEGGSSLSGGEKQRISIARAILKDAPIIVFDEATANVDPENEDKLKRAIEGLTKNKTVIMIAHRLKTIRNADQIIVLKDGGIEDHGTHDELMQRDGTYKSFIKAREMAESWKL